MRLNNTTDMSGFATRVGEHGLFPDYFDSLVNLKATFSGQHIFFELKLNESTNVSVHVRYTTV